MMPFIPGRAAWAMESQMTSGTTSNIPSAVLRPPEAAAFTGISESTLAKLRMTGGGPHYVKLTGRSVGYLRTDLDAFLASRRVRTTSDLGAASAAA